MVYKNYVVLLMDLCLLNFTNGFMFRTLLPGSLYLVPHIYALVTILLYAHLLSCCPMTMHFIDETDKTF